MGLLLSQSRQVLFPLDRQERLFLIVAALAGGNQIPLCTFPPANQRHTVVHGEVPSAHGRSAVAADPVRAPPFPPRRRPERSRLFPLPPQISFADPTGELRV